MMRDGSILTNEEGARLSIQARFGDKVAQGKIEEAAKYWLGPDFEGHPVFLPGARQISKSEYEDQMDRMLNEYIPDPVEELRQLRGEA